MMKQMIRRFWKLKERGQGETEYIVMLALVGIVTVGGLIMLGPKLSAAFFQVSDTMADQQQASSNSGGAENNPPGGSGSGQPVPPTLTVTSPTATPIPSKVSITKTEYKKEDHKVKLEATFDGGADRNVTLTVSPVGAEMKYKKDHYEVKIAVYGCPCEVTVTASNGDIAMVTVGAENDDGDDGEHGDDGGKKDDGGGKHH